MVSRVKALAEALEGSEVSDLDLTESGTRVVLRRRLATLAGGALAARDAPARGRRARPPRLDGAVGAHAPDPGVAVVAPFTGVFYGSPSPSSAPFALEGESVQAGQVVCIIEAMKVFNEVKSEIAGTLVKVLAQDGQLVQKGEPVVRIQPS